MPGGLRYLEVLRRRAGVVLVTTIVTVSVVALGSSSMAPVYSASTLVRIGVMRNGTADFADVTYSERLMNTYVHLLKSGPFLERVIRQLNLGIETSTLANLTKVEVLSNTELIKVSTESTSPTQAALIANTLAELLVEQQQSDEELRANAVSIVEYANPARQPSRPNVRLYLLLGLIASLGGGVALAFLLESLDPTVHSPDGLEELAGLPLLGQVPAFKRPNRSNKPMLLSEQASWRRQDEAFRLLAMNIQALTSDKPPRTLLVTSPQPRAGTSTVLANLAAAMARAGRRVILVDGNASHPCLHEIFDVANDVGLGEILLNPFFVTSVLQDTRTPGLRIVASGSLPSLSPELLGSIGMKSVIQRLSEDCDLVLFDGPPVALSSDAATIAPMVDASILVVASGRSPGDQIAPAIKQMDRVGARMLGLVFNMAKGGSRDYPSHETISSSRTVRSPAVRSLIRSLRRQVLLPIEIDLQEK